MRGGWVWFTPLGVVLRLNGCMGSSAVDQLWQALAESEVALVCVRGPHCSRWEDLMTPGSDAVGELMWFAREAGEIAEQFRGADGGSGAPAGDVRC